MRFSFVILTTISFVLACKNQSETKPEPDYTGFSERRIVLAGINKEYKQTDTLGVLTIKIPARLDTFYQWHKTSDCLPCGRMKYRFADKNYQQFAESGFYWTYKPDSIYQFTISHNPIREAPDNILINAKTISDTNEFEYSLIHECERCDEASFLSKTFKEINGRTFIISSFISGCSKIIDTTALFFLAETCLSNRRLHFIAECNIKDSSGFIDNMYKSLLSVRIEEEQ